ncbi:hypothetical protein DL93DRAFT_2174300 [Clavulina sp. PMI_390]|nr:hypothetical protein DL93DRAFT_2174300 [Clavulina sp. PMI_390]
MDLEGHALCAPDSKPHRASLFSDERASSTLELSLYAPLVPAIAKIFFPGRQSTNFSPSLNQLPCQSRLARIRVLTNINAWKLPLLPLRGLPAIAPPAFTSSRCRTHILHYCWASALGLALGGALFVHSQVRPWSVDYLTTRSMVQVAISIKSLRDAHVALR